MNGLLMDDKQLHQEPSGTGRTAQPALFRTVLSDETGLSRNGTMPCRQPSMLKCAGTSRGQYVDAFTDWTMQRIDELAAENRRWMRSSPTIHRSRLTSIP